MLEQQAELAGNRREREVRRARITRLRTANHWRVTSQWASTADVWMFDCSTDVTMMCVSHQTRRWNGKKSSTTSLISKLPKSNTHGVCGLDSFTLRYSRHSLGDSLTSFQRDFGRSERGLQKVTNTRDVLREVGRKLLSAPGNEDKLWMILQQSGTKSTQIKH